ncbi:MAG: hypothetical protein Fur005_24670 [Roseiflexaceae bacterium]
MIQQFQAIPLVQLVHPREQIRPIALTFLFGVALGVLAVTMGLTPLWGAVLAVLALLMVAAIPKWLIDRQRYGTPAMVLCILVATQGFHTVEHIAQWIQFHILRWPFFKASGLISPANAEWVHFVWNWAVLLTVIYLFRNGMRGIWAVLLLAWAGAHTFEHSYLMLRYLDTLGQLSALGVRDVAAQGLPGILGRDGWLASAEVTQNTFLCRLPGLATAQRLDVHFWWNVGEITLLLPAANAYMSRILQQR